MCYSLDNASAKTTVMLSLTPMLDGYLGFDVDPIDPTKKIYHVVHQRCDCHIINLIVKIWFENASTLYRGL